MSVKFTAVITKEEKWYVAHCIELGVVSQGRTIEEARANLKEAVELYLESFGTDDLPESAGKTLQEIEGLELKALGPVEDKTPE